MRVRAGEGAPPRPFQQAWRQKPGMSGSCRQASVVIYAAMLACLMHWYISMLYVVPVATVGGWGWWSSKRISRRQAQRSRQA